MRSRAWIAALLLILHAAGAGASGLEAPPGRLSVHGNVLVLNGFGERAVLLTPAYACALYLPRRSASPERIIDPRAPAALRIEVLHEDPPGDMPGAWTERLARELDPALMQRLEAAYARLAGGDVVVIAYAPRNGSFLSINGHEVVTDPGHGLMAAFLGQWLGPEPVSEDLRRALLGGYGSRTG